MIVRQNDADGMRIGTGSGRRRHQTQFGDWSRPRPERVRTARAWLAWVREADVASCRDQSARAATASPGRVGPCGRIRPGGRSASTVDRARRRPLETACPKTPAFFPGSSGTTWLSSPALASTDNSPLKFWALASAHSRGPGHRVLSPHRSTSVEATPRKALLWRPRNTGRPTGYTLLRRRHSSKGAELQVVVAERLLFAREGGAFPAYAHRES